MINLFPTACGLYRGFGSIQCCLSVPGDLTLCDYVEELGLQGCRRVIVAYFHLSGPMANLLERRLHRIIAENFTDTECVLWQDSDDLPKRDDFDVLLDACVLAAGKMTLV